jgi:hypothetical protein
MRLRCPALLIRNDPSMKQGSREARDRGSHSNEMRTGLVCLFIEVNRPFLLRCGHAWK